MRPSTAAALLSLAILPLSTGPARGQGPGGSVWVSLDGQPAGTPARVMLDTESSGPFQTYFDVFVSGFYVTTRVGDDGRTYQDLDVPGLPRSSSPGQPRLPMVRVDLGIVTDAAAASLTESTALDLRTLPGYLVWPSPIPALMHEGTPPQFMRDSTTYASAVDVPPGDGVGGAIRPTLGGIPAALCTAYPVHWNPATGTLTVAAHARFGVSHGGGLGTPMNLTKERARAASAALFNWGAIGSEYTVDWTRFNGAYLFVCPNAWLPTLQPLIQEKKTRGFAVTVVAVPQTGETCAQLEQSIQGWYAATPPGEDHYCLLVGSFGSMPYCTGPGGQVSDKVLSSVDGDGEPEIFLGRLYASGTAELQNQITKILDYETGPQVNNDGNVLLVASLNDSYFDFVGYQEGVRTASYADVPPSFSKVYGSNPAYVNGDIASGIASGVGVVAYAGHGFPDRWDRWSYSGTSFDQSDALALLNGSLTPVVWSIACDTGDLRVGGSLASGFMKNTQGGAVAFYGAVDPTYGTITEVLEDSLFQAVYGRGITRHGQAIALAEHAMVVGDSLYGFDAAYKYVLYGDPEMAIKRHNPGGIWAPIDLVTPISVIGPCPGVDCCASCPPPMIDIQVRDAAGAPVPGVKVGLWKPRLGGDDEVLENRYSGADGWAHVPAPGLTAGTLYVGYDDGDGRAGRDSINVEPPSTSGVDAGAPVPLRLTAAPSVTSGGCRLAFGRALGQPARIRVFSADGRLVRDLAAASGAAFVEWDGRDGDGRPAATGLYLVRLDAGESRASTRVVVLR